MDGEPHKSRRNARFAKLTRVSSAGHKEPNGTAYPYPTVLSAAKFDAAADELGLCRQERRVTMGRVLHYSLREIAGFMGLSVATVRHYDRSARQRTGCEEAGDLVRRLLALLQM